MYSFFPPPRVEMILDREEARRKEKEETGGRLTDRRMNKICIESGQPILYNSSAVSLSL